MTWISISTWLVRIVLQSNKDPFIGTPANHCNHPGVENTPIVQYSTIYLVGMVQFDISSTPGLLYCWKGLNLPTMTHQNDFEDIGKGLKQNSTQRFWRTLQQRNEVWRVAGLYLPLKEVVSYKLSLKPISPKKMLTSLSCQKNWQIVLPMRFNNPRWSIRTGQTRSSTRSKGQLHKSTSFSWLQTKNVSFCRHWCKHNRGGQRDCLFLFALFMGLHDKNLPCAHFSRTKKKNRKKKVLNPFCQNQLFLKLLQAVPF